MEKPNMVGKPAVVLGNGQFRCCRRGGKNRRQGFTKSSGAIRKHGRREYRATNEVWPSVHRLFSEASLQTRRWQFASGKVVLFRRELFLKAHSQPYRVPNGNSLPGAQTSRNKCLRGGRVVRGCRLPQPCRRQAR